MRPGSWLKVSQIDRPPPSSATAPSIWKAAVAAPQMKPSGKRTQASGAGRVDAAALGEVTPAV